MVRRLCALITVVALLATACSSELPQTLERPPESIALADPTTTSSTTTVAPTSTESTTTVAPTSTFAPNEDRTWIATARDHVAGLVPFVEPDGERFEMPWYQPNPHQFGTALTLMVTEGQPGDDWVKVQLPIKPNGQEAWVPTADYEISAIFHRAEINLTTRQVTVWESGEVIAESDAVVGASSSPTPIGSFFVISAVDDYYGEPALVLSSFSEALDTFSGGLPVIAIHKTFAVGQASDPNAASNGCIRIPTETLRFLAEHVPLGTPVDIVV